MRRQREAVARFFREALAGVQQLELPPDPPDRIHAWHLFPVRVRLERLRIDRNALVEQLRDRRIGCSVHWRPLHLHRYYEQAFGWRPEQFPVASAQWTRTVSLPLFPDMREEERQRVVQVVRELCAAHAVEEAH
jgi:perosamine synthetase